MHACFVFWILLEPLVSSSVLRDLLERFFVLNLQGHGRLHLYLQTFHLRFFDGFFELSVSRIDEINASQCSEHSRALVFRWPIAAFSFSELLLTCLTMFQATNNQVWLLLEFL